MTMSVDHECTDPTDPQYYLDRSAHSDAEADMRADYALAYQTRRQAEHADTLAERTRLTVRANRIRRAWTVPNVRTEWDRLDQAVDRWTHDPKAMQMWHDRRDAGHMPGPPILPIDERTQQQARELTGHGPWVSTPSIDAARFTPETPPPTFGKPTRRRIERSR